MKATFIRLIYFFSILITLFVLFTFTFYYSYKQYVESDLKSIAEYECIIMGDSQLQRLKPDLFDYKTYNFASSGEHYYFTYQKIQKILEFKDHRIKKIIVGVSLPSFAPAYNRLFDLNFPEGENSLERYLYFIYLNNTEFLKLKDLIKKNVLRSIMKGIFNKPDWGGLFVSQVENPDSLTINKVFNIHYGMKKNENPVSKNQILYLSKIQQICVDNHIDLYLVSGPNHPLYKKKVDSLYYNVLYNTTLSLKNTKYINYLNDQVNSNLMSDPVHLNSKGADIYSKMINDSININAIKI